tara:strand:- start:3584 stop:5362 length:1779 start_codon:yes stop_codon:yes gene_type:complete
MCGYLGEISFETIDKDSIINSNKRIECRGPDSKRIENDKIEDIHYTFIFNRLSILDLTSEADQPMRSLDGKSIVLFNGEIYNHMELRAKLESKGVKFRTKRSDTEVVLNGLKEMGDDFVHELRGQFAIAYFDLQKRNLMLIRDRLGQKPIFYYLDKEKIIFGSNLLSIKEKSNKSKISEEGLREYLEKGVIQSPNTIYKKINKLKPAEIINISFKKNEIKKKSKIYWNPEDFIDEKTFIDDEFFNLFSESIHLRTQADVDVANFLSGGIDSSSIAKNLNDNGNNLNTFSVRFENSKYDESKWSRLVAEKYNTNHTEVDLKIDISYDKVNSILSILDEPYSDPSVIPSYLLCNAISKEYKVAISGDGGDELLGGYQRISNSLLKKSKLQNMLPNLYSLYPPFLGSGANLTKFSNDIAKAYSTYLYDEKFLNYLGIDSNKSAFETQIRNLNISDYKKLSIMEYNLFLSEMMMLKVDRTSMSNSLEVRSPFVDHKLVEYVFSHRPSYFNIGNPKKILKEYLLDDFGSDFTNRSKMGFIFDLESFIYSNKNLINDNLDSLDIGIEKNVFSYFSKFKTRINANRIWKLLVLSSYLTK